MPSQSNVTGTSNTTNHNADPLPPNSSVIPDKKPADPPSTAPEHSSAVSGPSHASSPSSGASATPTDTPVTTRDATTKPSSTKDTPQAPSSPVQPPSSPSALSTPPPASKSVQTQPVVSPPPSVTPSLPSLPQSTGEDDSQTAVSAQSVPASEPVDTLPVGPTHVVTPAPANSSAPTVSVPPRSAPAEPPSSPVAPTSAPAKSEPVKSVTPPRDPASPPSSVPATSAPVDSDPVESVPPTGVPVQLPSGPAQTPPAGTTQIASPPPVKSSPPPRDPVSVPGEIPTVVFSPTPVKSGPVENAPPVLSTPVATPPATLSHGPAPVKSVPAESPTLVREPSLPVVVFSSGEPTAPTLPTTFFPSNSIPSPNVSLSMHVISPANHLQENNNSSVSVSTITDAPETTLSSPVFVSTTDSVGRVSLSVPPVFTSVALSREPNGSFASVTHVIANPTGIWGINNDSAASKQGFFANTGAVAGVFLAVGIVLSAIVGFLLYFLCRRRRRRSTAELRQSISRPLPMPENPFEDPRESPSPTQMQMRYAHSDSSHRDLVGGGLGLTTGHAAGRGERNLLDDEMEPDSDVPPAPLPPSVTYGVRPQPPTPAVTFPPNTFPLERGRQPVPRPVPRPLPNQRPPSETMGLAGIGSGVSAGLAARRNSVGHRPYNGPFSDYHATAYTRAGGHVRAYSVGGPMPSVMTEQTRMISDLRDAPLRPPPALTPTMEMPSAESSPSIYPASLPPAPTPTPGDHGHDTDSSGDSSDVPPVPKNTPASTPMPPLQSPSPTPATPDNTITLATGVARPRPKPPVIPPKSPLRHSNHTPLASPTDAMPKQPLLIQTQISAPQLSSAYKRDSYEPLTPPGSVSSASETNKTEQNPFLGYDRTVRVQAPALTSFPSASTTLPATTSSSSSRRAPGSSGSSSMSSADGNAPPTPESPNGKLPATRENYYTRRKMLEIRPAASVEWKN